MDRPYWIDWTVEDIDFYGNSEVVEVSLSASCHYERRVEYPSVLKFKVFIPREDIPQFIDFDWIEDAAVKAAKDMMRDLLRGREEDET